MKVKSLSHIRLFATLWTVAHQAPPSMGFSRQDYWSGLPFPPPSFMSFVQQHLFAEAVPSLPCLSDLKFHPSPLPPLSFSITLITTVPCIFHLSMVPILDFFSHFIYHSELRPCLTYSSPSMNAHYRVLTLLFSRFPFDAFYVCAVLSHSVTSKSL